MDEVLAHRPALISPFIEMTDRNDSGPVQVLVGGQYMSLVALQQVNKLFIVATLPASGIKVSVLAPRVLRQQLSEDFGNTSLHSVIAEF